MIRDDAAYARLREADRWKVLSAMTMAESIAVGEALLTSELMTLARFPEEERPRSLARALGIHPARPAPR